MTNGPLAGAPLSPCGCFRVRSGELIADGHSNEGIGERLFLSPRTVEKHIARSS